MIRTNAVHSSTDEPVTGTYDDVYARLTADGAPFEMIERMAGDKPCRDYLHRPRHISELLKLAADFGPHECMVFGDTRISYTEFVKQVRSFANALVAEMDLRQGERVAILSFNRPEWVIAMWGILVAGGVVVALNSWWSETEITHALDTTNTRILIADQKGSLKVSRGAIERQTIIVIESEQNGKTASGGVLRFTDLLKSQHLALRPGISKSGSEPAVVFFTSGTTGKAKAVSITHQAWIISLMNARFAATIAMMREPKLAAVNDAVRVLADLPFFHVGGGHGLAFAGIAAGHTLIIPDRKFDPDHILSLIEAKKITRWSAVPSTVQAVCHAAKNRAVNLTSLQTIAYGAAPSSPGLQDMAYQAFPGLKAVSNAYGMTEAGAVFAMNTGVDYRKKPDSAGRAFPTIDIRIADEDGHIVKTGSVGEIQVRGPLLLGQSFEDAEGLGFVGNGWLQTGDSGHLDEQGFLYIGGRIKDVIIRGGENILAAEVETRLEDHPGILEAAVSGVASDRFGEEVKAVLRVEKGQELTVADVQSWVGERLAAFKVPRHIEFCYDPLPRNAVGKLLKTKIGEK
jgi:steroid-24-oyl-CoA synthetase